MKIHFQRKIYFILWASLLVACGRTLTIVSPISSVEPTETTIADFPQETETQGSAVMNITPQGIKQPTLKVESSIEYILSLLQTNNLCNLPCFWGVTPGNSWKSDSERLRYFVPYISDTFQADKGTLHEIESNVGLSKHGISLHISVLEKHDQIEYVTAQLASESYTESLKAFMPNEVLAAYGTPQVIRLYLGSDALEPEYQFYHLWLIYKEKGFYVLYKGYAVKKQSLYELCPTNQHYELEVYSDKYGVVEIGSVLKSNDNTVEKFILDRFNSIYRDSMLIDNVTNLNNMSFSELFLKDSVACITTHSVIWIDSTK